ncbi:DUF2169 domain-containing protein [candidate division KSB1 bacterium]|nr:DUF2169 domain-containing protein [candidate division KSB1 bacterium]
MDIVNETSFLEGFVVGIGPKRQPTLTIIIKGTFAVPQRSKMQAVQAETQLPLAATDEYYNGNVTGSTKIESDLVPFKPRADIVLVGKAHAPGKRPVTAMDVVLRVGNVSKTIRVFGDRMWSFASKLFFIPVISDPPQPFIEMPLVYERAYGGIDHKAGKWCKENLIGRGFIGKKSKDSIHEKLLPNLEDPNQLIESWDSQPRPVGFGFCGRGWQPRAGYIGPIDDKHPPDAATDLPTDFRFDFYNGAHPDLQAPGYLRGDEDVEMRHLSRQGHLLFRLPGLRPVITVSRLKNSPSANKQPATEELPLREEKIEAPLDTLVFLPDEGIFYQVWRGLCPLSELSVEEISAIKIQLTKV